MGSFTSDRKRESWSFSSEGKLGRLHLTGREKVDWSFSEGKKGSLSFSSDRKRESWSFLSDGKKKGY